MIAHQNILVTYQVVLLNKEKSIFNTHFIVSIRRLLKPTAVGTTDTTSPGFFDR